MRLDCPVAVAAFLGSLKQAKGQQKQGLFSGSQGRFSANRLTLRLCEFHPRIGQKVVGLVVAQLFGHEEVIHGNRR